MKSKKLKYLTIVLVLMLVLIFISAASCFIGSADIFRENPTQIFDTIIKIRLPRIILGLIVGGALSLSGAILQGMFRNPLVEPYTLGISGGSSLAVCIGIMLNLSRIFAIDVLRPLTGFAGALGVLFLVYFLGSNRKELKNNGMLLTGVMISFISSSLIMLILSLSRAENAQSIIFWLMGTLKESNNILILIIADLSLIAVVWAFFYSNDLNALSLGDEEAINMGINAQRSKKILFIITSVLTGFSVSVAGSIGFVGLIVPHFVRMLVSNDYRILLAASWLGGAIFLIACDTIARTILFPMGLELPVGVITGIIGGFLMLFILSKKQVKL